MIRDLRLPVLLVLTGALFLADYAGSYSVYQTWPILLIWLGLTKLLESLDDGARQGPPAG
jgi:hypothetical protein